MFAREKAQKINWLMVVNGNKCLLKHVGSNPTTSTIYFQLFKYNINFLNHIGRMLCKTQQM